MLHRNPAQIAFLLRNQVIIMGHYQWSILFEKDREIHEILVSRNSQGYESLNHVKQDVIDNFFQNGTFRSLKNSNYSQAKSQICIFYARSYCQ